MLAWWLRCPPRERQTLGSISGSSQTGDMEIGTQVVTLLGAWRYRVSARTGWPGVSILWLGVVAVGCLLNVPATGECISGTDLLRQFYVLPHSDRSCRSNVLPHPVTVYWHRADQSQRWPYNARRLAGQPLECQFLSHWYDSTPKKIPAPAGFEPGTFRSRGGRLNHQANEAVWLGEVESSIYNFYLSVAARKTVWADPFLQYTSMLLGR